MTRPVHLPRPRCIGRFRLAPICLLAAGLAMLSGCQLPETHVVLQGHVYGGQQPIAGATVSLYAAGTTRDGAGSISLLTKTILTDATGAFNLTGTYTCPSASTQVYLVARGGAPLLQRANSASVLMSAIGSCASIGSAASTTLLVNEVTTAGAAWALAQFMSAGGVVGATVTNSSGLANAFAVANSLANPATGATPGSLTAGAAVETAKLNSLANALASCVDTAAGCNALFSAAAVAGVAPSNTLDAALNIVRHPSASVSAIFNLAGQSPFAPALTAPPHDWTMSITYGGCTPACGGLNLPGSLAIDSPGNIVVADYFGGVFSKFSPTGVPAQATGISGVALQQSYGIAVDAADNVWVTNEQSVTAAGRHPYGSVSEFTSAGVEISGDGYTGGGIFFPVAAAADSNGDIWLADSNGSAATLLANSGAAISGSSGYASSAIAFPSAVAIDASHNAWFAVEKGVARVTPAGAITGFACCSGPSGIAIDASGNVWVADYDASAVVELNPQGGVLQRTVLANGAAEPKGIAVDGAGNVWVVNYFGNTLDELAGTTAATVSPTAGYGLDASLAEPYGLAIDASGNLWISNAASNRVTQFVGLASPVKTPLLGPPTQP